MGWTESYHRAAAALADEFSRNRRLHGSRIQCRAGCSDCCSQLFQITEIEAAIVSEGVARLPEAARLRLQTRARHYVAERQRLFGSGGTPEAWGSLPKPGSRLPCPALDGGVCTLYDHRPLICRKYGIPLYHPDRPGRVAACELNFADGEAIEDGQLVQIQTAIHEDWKQVQADYNDAGGFRDDAPITVARAIVEDFRFCLNEPESV